MNRNYEWSYLSHFESQKTTEKKATSNKDENYTEKHNAEKGK